MVALSASIGFLLGLGASAIPWDAVVALLIGGVFAAPIAAWLLTKVPQQVLGLLVGFLIVFLNTRQLSMAFELSGTLRWTLLGLIVLAGVIAVSNNVRQRGMRR
jgi:uncharacterized membrane protein YjdF